MFISYFLNKSLDFYLVNCHSIYQNSKSKLFESLKFLSEIFNNCPNGLLRINVYKTLESSWESLLTILQCTNSNSVISKWVILALFLSLDI